RGQADLDTAAAQILDLVQILVRRGLAETVEPASAIRDVKEDEGDARGIGRFRRAERLLEPEVVELADRGVAGGEHLAVDLLVAGADALGRLPVGELEHRVAPGPEVAALGAAPERSLASGAVRFGASWERESVRHVGVH